MIYILPMVVIPLVQKLDRADGSFVRGLQGNIDYPISYNSPIGV